MLGILKRSLPPREMFKRRTFLSSTHSRKEKPRNQVFSFLTHSGQAGVKNEERILCGQLNSSYDLDLRAVLEEDEKIEKERQKRLAQ
eukprot:5121477-Amphidinium_carterae.1